MGSYQPTYSQSYALLIGVDAYQQISPLTAAVYGATRLKDTLSDLYGFDVTLLTDHMATGESIFNWLSHVQHEAGPDDRVLIYFAGHGLTRGSGPTERGYLALTGTQQSNWRTAIRMDDITEEAQYLPAKHLLYLLDCCFGGLALEGRSADDRPRELAYYLTRPVRYAISAGGKEVVDDSYAPDGQSSLFAYHLLRWLDQDYYTPAGRIWRARDLGNYLEGHVARDRHSGHLPQHGHLSGSGGGDFIFHWDTGPRFAPELEMAIRADNGYIRWGAVASLIDLARSDDQLADLAVTHLEEMAASDPDERVRGAAQSYFDELEALRLADKERTRIDQERARLTALEAQLEEARRQQAASEAALREAEEARRQAEKAREITPLPGTGRTVPSPPTQTIHRKPFPWASIGGIGALIVVGIIGLIALLNGAASPEPTDPPATTSIPLGYPGNPVTNNDQWTLVIDEFNGVQMVFVPAGCFMMGSEDYDDQKPIHKVCFDEPFWIDVYEVTNAQFEAFGGEAGRNSNWTGDDRPRERITWIESEAFCNLRGSRLPTEAEWEYAARGPDSLVYPWGDDFVADNVVFYENSGSRTWDVGSKPGGISWVGAYDLSGNVWEWVNSLYMDYPYDPGDGREVDGNSNSARVLRGGSWDSNSLPVRAANRLKYTPDLTWYALGFRCARSYSP